MANKSTRPSFPLGMRSIQRSQFDAGIDTVGLLNNGLLEHGDGATFTLPEGSTALNPVTSALRYNPVTNTFQGAYATGGWKDLVGGLTELQIKAIYSPPAGSGLIGVDNTTVYPNKTVGAKLSSFILIEDYADVDATFAAGDHTNAIQAAINAGITKSLPVRGYGKYFISKSVVIDNTPVAGFDLYLDTVSVLSTFPKSTSFWNATAMFVLGGVGANLTGLNIHINALRGGSETMMAVADGFIVKGNGFALSTLHIGNAMFCRAVIRTGGQSSPNASVWVTGDFWTQNYVGVVIRGGQGAAPIVEGWKIFVKFIAANLWTGVWFMNAGQYAQISGDHDFNGTSLAVLRLSDATGIDIVGGQYGGLLTDGTHQLEFLMYYTFQGYVYVVVACPDNVSYYNGDPTKFPWAIGSTITSVTPSSLAIKFDGVGFCGDNSSRTNFYDVLHDFQLTAFAKIQVTAGYLSGIIGGSMHSSVFFFQNSFSGVTQSINGMAVSNSGSALALYNLAYSNSPFMNVTNEFVNFEKRLYIKDHKIVGNNTFVTLPISTAEKEWWDVMGIVDSTNDKYGNEGSNWHVEIITNFQGVFATHDVAIWGGGNALVTNQQHPGLAIFEWRYMQQVNDDSSAIIGINLQVRQVTQPTMQFSINMVRIG